MPSYAGRSNPPREISSLQNPWIKEIRKALRKGSSTESGLLVAEGLHLYEEALRSGRQIVAAFATEPLGDGSILSATGLTLVSPPVLKEISSLESPAAIVALIEPAPPLEALPKLEGRLALVLDGLQDPGNAGTLIRAAEAFGFAAVIALSGCVDLYSPKVLRASSGSAFRVPLWRGADWSSLHASRVPIYATLPKGGPPPRALDWSRGGLIVAGSEGHGVSADILAQAIPVSIPTLGVESLNAAVAAAIVMYEASLALRPSDAWSPV